jgi:cardiolipin synthase
MPFNLPIFLTWLRIVAIPLVVGVFYLPAGWLAPFEQNVAATALFIAAALTDWLDGWLARRLDQTSPFGAFLDPVADKLMVTAALLVLLELHRVDAAIALIIVGREITISALREWMAHIGASRSVAVNSLGKIKTVLQMVAIPMLLFDGRLLLIDMHWLGTCLIVVAAVLTVWSMLYYIRRAWPSILARSSEKR